MGRPEEQRWRKVRGHISGVICTLLCWRWKPLAANRWEDPEGETWIFNNQYVDKYTLNKEIERHITKQLFEKAAAHDDGKGLEGGMKAKKSKL